MDKQPQWDHLRLVDCVRCTVNGLKLISGATLTKGISYSCHFPVIFSMYKQGYFLGHRLTSTRDCSCIVFWWFCSPFTALFQYVSTDSREFSDILQILTSSYKDSSSAGTFVYSKPRLVHSEPLEKDVRPLDSFTSFIFY